VTTALSIVVSEDIERRLRARLHHGQQSHEVIASATTGQLGMAAAGQIQLAVVSAAAGDRDSAYGTVISMTPSHCQSTFVLHVQVKAACRCDG
jgi:hypothetical protein